VSIVEFVELTKAGKARHLCRLAQEFVEQGRRVLVVVEDDNQALTLDRYMWTWDKGSFLPHVWDNGAQKCYEDPVVIVSTQRNSNGAQVLVAGSECELSFMRQFEHVIEFAETYDDALCQQARRRFSKWREVGCGPRMR